MVPPHVDSENILSCKCIFRYVLFVKTRAFFKLHRAGSSFFSLSKFYPSKSINISGNWQFLRKISRLSKTLTFCIPYSLVSNRHLFISLVAEHASQGECHSVWENGKMPWNLFSHDKHNQAWSPR